MKPFRNFVISTTTLTILAVANAQRTTQNFDKAVKRARTTEIEPQKEAPAWMEYDRTANG